MDNLQQDENQESVQRIWALLDQIKETEDDSISLTEIYWRQNQLQEWEFIKISHFGSTFHKTYGKVGGQFKIAGQEFRDNRLAGNYWVKQADKIDDTFLNESSFSKVAGKVFAETEDELFEKIAAITSCFLTTIINEGFANFEKDMFDDIIPDCSDYSGLFHLWTCNKKLLLQRLTEIKKLLPTGFKIYQTDNFDRYIKRYKKEPKVLFEK